MARSKPNRCGIAKRNNGPTKAVNAPPGSFAFSGHDRTHAHMIQADPSGKFVLHVDLGLDKIFIWKFDEATGHSAQMSSPRLRSAGDGPRHFHFHPNGKMVLFIQKKDRLSYSLTRHQTGKLAQRQRFQRCLLVLPVAISALKSWSRTTENSSTLAIVARQYWDIRGPNRRTLKYIGEEWTRVTIRAVSTSIHRAFLYCCNQRGDNVAVFRRKTQLAS